MKRFFPILCALQMLSCLVFFGFASGIDIGTPVSVRGELTILNVDDFDHGIGETVYHLKDSRTNKVYKLRFAGELPGKLKTGAIVTAKGRAKGEEILLADSGGVQLVGEPVASAAVSGEQKTIVIMANFLDQTVSCSGSDIQSRVFTDPLNQSIDDFYQEVSFDQVWLTGGVVGPYVINYGSTSTCNLSGWAAAADAAALASGVNLSSYNRKIYVMPRTNPCGYTGVGTLGGNPSMAWIFRCDGSDTYAHELGHNLGMHHAATPTNEYGDTSDIMGYSGFGLRHINAPHQDQVGWLAPRQIVTVSGSGTYHIAPLELGAPEASYPQILLIPKPDTGEDYYLSYRQPIGFDANLSPTYTKGVNIHRATSNSGTKTYYLNVLADGGVFTDATNGITVTQTSHMNQYATVQIQLGNPPSCVTSTPTVSLSPAGQSAQAGTVLAYSVTVTNMDNTACGQSTFSLAPSVPMGWTGTVSPATLTLAPGTTGTATVSVASPIGATTGNYSVTMNVSDGAIGIHAASKTVTYTVLPRPTCVSATPQISISPSSQTGQAGSTLGYSVSVANRDSADCQQTTFNLGRSIPTGWAGAFSPASLTLAPGTSGSSTLSITSLASATAGNYGITASASDAATSGHSALVTATYTVAPDTVPPSVPAALTARLVRGKVNLSWAASTDNVRVSGYRVWRNNALIGQTLGTGFTDSAVTAGQTYTYFVTAYDAAGNASASSNTVTVTVTGNKKK